MNTKRYTTFFGEKESLAEVSRRVGIPLQTLYYRLFRMGWSEAAAFLTPIAPRTDPRVAPKGECPFCDRRRENKRVEMERRRKRTKLREKREGVTHD